MNSVVRRSHAMRHDLHESTLEGRIISEKWTSGSMFCTEILQSTCHKICQTMGVSH